MVPLAGSKGAGQTAVCSSTTAGGSESIANAARTTERRVRLAEQGTRSAESESPRYPNRKTQSPRQIPANQVGTDHAGGGEGELTEGLTNPGQPEDGALQIEGKLAERPFTLKYGDS